MSWTTANNPLEVENSSSTERSETSQGTAKDNSDNCATFSRMQQTQKNELFLYRISKYLQTRRYHSGHGHQAKPKKSNSKHSRHSKQAALKYRQPQ